MIRSIFSRSQLELSEDTLLSMIKGGKDEAFAYLYKRAFPLVKQFVIQNNGKLADAEDVFQDGMLALWDNIRSDKFVHQEGAKLSSYLIKICKYRWLDRLKSAGFKMNTQMPDYLEKEDENDSVLQHLISSEEILDFESKFRKLGDRCQEILKLYYYEKKSMAEIADMLGMQASSVKNEKYRCMERLKKLF